MAIELPSVVEVTAELRDMVASIDWDDGAWDDGAWIDVRLQVQESGSWMLYEGDASFDTDHSGFWGASTLGADSDCEEIAADLIDQCAEDAAQCE